MTDNSSNGCSSNQVAGIMIALSVGLLAGAAGALLFAPASGRNTRRRIGELAGDVVDRTGRAARDVVDRADRITQRAGDALRDRAGRVEEVVVGGKQAYRQAQEILKS